MTSIEGGNAFERQSKINKNSFEDNQLLLIRQNRKMHLF